MNNPFKKYFVDEEPPAADLTDCREVIEFARTPYFSTFMAYLERGADEQLQIGDAIQMVKSASRVNTYKEIRAHLRRQVRDAQEIIDREGRNE